MNQETLTLISTIAAVASVLVTAVGLYFVSRQIHEASKIANADFVFRLENEFIDHFSETYQKFLADEDFAVNGNGQIVAIEHYLDFFATLQILRSQNLISLDVIDRMFAFRFFIVANQQFVRDCVKGKEEYWTNLRQLYGDWVQHRIANGQAIPNNSVRLFDAEQSHALEPAVGPVSIGKSSPPAQ